jgi:DNA-binding phage protein
MTLRIKMKTTPFKVEEYLNNEEIIEAFIFEVENDSETTAEEKAYAMETVARARALNTARVSRSN